MNTEEYKKKLDGFNATEKYQREMEVLWWMVNPKQGESILDFGCGTGTALKFLTEKSGARVLGFDRYEYMNPMPDWFRAHIYFAVHKVYFMHSLAHIEYPKDTLEQLKQYLLPKATLTVITPNALWIKKAARADYVPDPTVIKHFAPGELNDLFFSAGYAVTHCGQFGTELDGQHERLFLQATVK